MLCHQPNGKTYGAIPNDDDDDAEQKDVEKTTSAPISLAKEEERKTYSLSLAFQLLSGLVWFSMSAWGIFIASYFSMAAVFDWEKFNVGFSDLYDPSHLVASFAICFHLIGAAFMTMAGAFQLVKYIRKVYPAYHRWVGRVYIFSSFIVAIGGVTYIALRGSGGVSDDICFLADGTLFFISAAKTLYYAIQKDFKWHKLWAWRLYSLTLGAWLYRFYFYWYGRFIGLSWVLSWGSFEYSPVVAEMINWSFYIPGLIVVEIIFRWGENTTLTSWQARVLDVIYGVALVLVAVFTVNSFFSVWFPAVAHFHSSDHKRWVEDFLDFRL